jgi:hypothetical protein
MNEICIYILKPGSKTWTTQYDNFTSTNVLMLGFTGFKDYNRVPRSYGWNLHAKKLGRKDRVEQ